MISTTWRDRNLAPHKTLKKFEVAVEKKSSRPGKERITHNDRITFSNGYAIEERSAQNGSDESGVLYFKSPQGDTTAADCSYSYIHADEDTDFQPAVYSRGNLPQTGGELIWQQSFPEEGGMKLKAVGLDFGERQKYPDFTISPEGELSASAYSQLSKGNEVIAKMDGDALVMQAGDVEFAVTPPVPAQWFLASEGPNS